MKKDIISPDTLVEELYRRKEELEHAINVIEKRQKNQPHGSIRVSSKSNRYQYYLIEEKEDGIGKYIPKKNENTIKKLAQKKYDADVKKEAECEHKLICNMLNKYTPEKIINIYSKSSKGRQMFIDPVISTDEEYKRNWNEIEYEHMMVGEEESEYITNRGEHVRSKSELIIANQLDKYGVPYKYEYPINLGNNITAHADFYCLNVKRRKEIVWEHFGMVDNEEYANNMVRKIISYDKKGYRIGDNFIMSFETLSYPLNTQFINRVIENNLLD
ncbi:MAG: hypothetical protein K6B67_00760 [Lachnospiraceae bacterium]|nr:hypothetical protein [Lachnospiraceae bacterium]